MFMKTKSDLIKRLSKHFSLESVIRFCKTPMASKRPNMTADQKNGLSIGFHPAILQIKATRRSVFQDFQELTSCYECFVFAKPTNQNCLQERDARQQKSDIQKNAVKAKLLT